MRDHEEQLLAERLADIRRVRRRDYVTIAAALLLGLITRGVVFWIFNRRVARSVRHLTENVRRLRAGQPLPHSPSAALDDSDTSNARSLISKTTRKLNEFLSS